MHIKLKNLGALRQAEFSLGDLTIICGRNNTGKTYATYALYGFLSFWRSTFIINIPDEKISTLFSDGVVIVDVSEYTKKADIIIKNGCKAYAEQLPEIFAAPKMRFLTTEFQVYPDVYDISDQRQFSQKISASSSDIFSLTKDEGSTELVVTFLGQKENVKIPKEIVKQIIGNAIKDIVFGYIFPNPFIASAERTGAAIFRKELNFARNRLLEEMGDKNKNVDPMELLFKAYQDYALPVKKNVDFTRGLESVAKLSSVITEAHPEILKDFADIIGGAYTVTRNDELYYIPNGTRLKLSMDESSSAVRSLLDIGFYLRHVAQIGDILIVDEPELNLHPENQRRLVRLFARLTNIGFKIFITTHSDYIIKELNTLIMLHQNKPHLKEIARKEGYKTQELISPNKVKVYIAEEGLVQLDGNKRKTRCQTLSPADISPETGIEARSFDITIETMNRIQEEIVWGA